MQPTNEQMTELHYLRIRNNRCPLCGAPVKDQGSYVRCVECEFQITHGCWNPAEGFCVLYLEEESG